MSESSFCNFLIRSDLAWFHWTPASAAADAVPTSSSTAGPSAAAEVILALSVDGVLLEAEGVAALPRTVPAMDGQ